MKRFDFGLLCGDLLLQQLQLLLGFGFAAGTIIVRWLSLVLRHSLLHRLLRLHMLALHRLLRLHMLAVGAIKSIARHGHRLRNLDLRRLKFVRVLRNPERRRAFGNSSCLEVLFGKAKIIYLEQLGLGACTYRDQIYLSDNHELILRKHRIVLQHQKYRCVRPSTA